MLVLTLQPLVMPAQLEVMLLLNTNWPTIVSALRISRDRSVRLPPAFIVWRPETRVTLSKTWKSFWFVMRGWFPFWPRFRMFWKFIWVMPEVESLRLMPGMPAAAAGFCR